MEQLKAKLKKQGGFTLIEMLIVVAIIAILIAVSIPLISNALEKTKHATDLANERAAKAELMIQYLADVDAVIDGEAGKTFETEQVYYYDANEGGISENVIPEADCYGQHGNHEKACLAIGISEDGVVKMRWTKRTINNFTSLDDSGLCRGTSAADCKNASVS